MKVYRDAVNSLIGLLEQVAYASKEEAVESIMKDFLVWTEFGVESSAPTEQPRKKESDGSKSHMHYGRRFSLLWEGLYSGAFYSYGER